METWKFSNSRILTLVFLIDINITKNNIIRMYVSLLCDTIVGWNFCFYDWNNLFATILFEFIQHVRDLVAILFLIHSSVELKKLN